MRRDRARDDNLESRLDFDGTVAPTDLSRATDAREKGRIGIFGSQLSYAGSSGRVTSEPLGRDLNPNGRGDGYGYMAGAFNVGKIAPRLPLSRANRGSGFSINNSDQTDPTPGGGGGGNRPACCECQNWHCCGFNDLAREADEGGSKCCCPIECSTDEMTCVGDGGIDDCGAVCELDDDLCNKDRGSYDPNQGCSGCGGAASGTPGVRAASSRIGHLEGLVRLPESYSIYNIYLIHIVVSNIQYPGQSLSLCIESLHQYMILAQISDPSQDEKWKAIRLAILANFLNCLKKLKEIWKSVRKLREITIDELQDLFNIDECCIVIRDLICEMCGSEELVQTDKMKAEVATFCLCCGRFNDYDGMDTRDWLDEGSWKDGAYEPDCYKCFANKMPNAMQEVFENLVKCINDKIIPDLDY